MHVLVERRHQLGTEVGAVLLVLWVVIHDLLGTEQLAQTDPVLFVEVDLHKLPYPVLEVIGLVLNVQSPPEDPLDVLEPLVADKLVPHGEGHSSSSVGLEDTETVPFVPEDHSHMIDL